MVFTANYLKKIAAGSVSATGVAYSNMTWSDEKRRKIEESRAKTIAARKDRQIKALSNVKLERLMEIVEEYCEGNVDDLVGDVERLCGERVPKSTIFAYIRSES